MRLQVLGGEIADIGDTTWNRQAPMGPTAKSIDRTTNGGRRRDVMEGVPDQW
jgi:hypothetical protein